jgi:hypothetical protein
MKPEHRPVQQLAASKYSLPAVSIADMKFMGVAPNAQGAALHV